MGRTATPMLGQTFGRLTVYDAAPRAVWRTNEAEWKARCSCGRTTLARGGTLRSGRVVSCGCRRLEIVRSWTKGVPHDTAQDA
jgi:Bacillus phage HNH endonuclease